MSYIAVNTITIIIPNTVYKTKLYCTVVAKSQLSDLHDSKNQKSKISFCTFITKKINLKMG